MLKCENITKRFGAVEVLKGVELSIVQGEIVTIVGPSGAGKTTLLQILSTLAKADSGNVWIDGVNINSLKIKELAALRNRQIGFVFQFHHLLPEFSAIENVCIPALIARESMAKSHIRAEELLRMMGLGDRLTHKPSALSGGEQQRVAVARALMMSPRIIFADEPSGNLDSHSRDELHSLFFELREKFGQTFIIVTHDNELALRSDRQIIMRDGQIWKE
ncbi:MAG: ABC transporter ATP-binding protein [Mucinivorans sp.]